MEEQKEPKPIAQSNVCEWKTAPLSSNSYSRVVASIPPQFIFKPFQPIVELVYGQKQEIYNEQSSWDLQIKSSNIKNVLTKFCSYSVQMTMVTKDSWLHTQPRTGHFFNSVHTEDLKFPFWFLTPSLQFPHHHSPDGQHMQYEK